DTAVLTGANDLVLLATGSDAMTTEAKTGAKSDKVSVAPAISIAISNVTVLATIGTGGTLVTTGKVDATATMVAAADTKADGDAEGGSKAAVGVAVGFTWAGHTVESWTLRSIDAGDNPGDIVSFQALGSSASSTTTKASANGAPDDSSSGGSTIDSLLQILRLFADSKANGNKPSGSGGSGTGSTSTPAASSPDGPVGA